MFPQHGSFVDADSSFDEFDRLVGLSSNKMSTQTPNNNNMNSSSQQQNQWYFSDNMFGDFNLGGGMNNSGIGGSSLDNQLAFTPLIEQHRNNDDCCQLNTTSTFDIDNDNDALTSKTTPTTQGKSKEKKKPKIACVYCNKLHKKCDGESPNACTRCKKKGIPCVYLPPQKRGPKSKKRKNNDGDEEEYTVEQLTCAAGLCANQNQQIQQIQQQQAQQQFNAPVYFNQSPPQQTQQQQIVQHQSQQPQKIVSSIDLDSYITEAIFSSNKNTNPSNALTNFYSQPQQQPSPLTGLQFTVNVHTRTLVDQFLDSVTCHSLVDRNMLDNALNKAVVFSSEPTGYQLLTNIVCAMGAQRLEDRKNCIEFFNRARNQASYLFDKPSRETSCALSLMGIYACSEGERIKGHMYNRIALDMSTDLCSYQIETDKYYQTLSALSLATTFSKWLFELNILKVEENSFDCLLKNANNPNHPQVPSIRELVKHVKNYIGSSKCMREIEEIETKIADMSLVRGSEEISFTAILVYYLLVSRLATLTNNQIEYIKILRKLETIEKYIESEKFNRDDLQKNVHRFCLYSLRSDILVRCGLDKMGLHCATKATGLSTKPTFWKSAPGIILFFPILINVNLNVNDSSMSIENYKSLKVISSKFVVLKYTLFDMINIMNKRSEFADLLESERQHVPQGITNSTGYLPFTNDAPQCESCPPQDWNTNIFDQNNNNESCFPNSDLTELLQQLGTVSDHESYQNKLESIWQSIGQ